MRALAVLAVVAGLWIAPLAAEAQEGPVAVRSEVDRTVMMLGDQVLLTITAELARGYDLQDPGVPRAVGDFEVVDTLTVLQTRMPSGATRIQLRFLITAFQLGPRRLPQIVVAYRGPDGARGEARTQGGHVITVQSVVQPDEDTSDIKPLKPPLPVPGAASELLSGAMPLALGALIVAAAALLALLVRRRGPVLIEAATHGPSRAALDELERVMELRLPDQGRTREQYELVAAALRTFIARRYGLAAEARTARELRRELERAGVGATTSQILCAALADAESVRYEERAISPAQAKRSMHEIVDLMRKSVVAEEYELVSSGATA